MFRVDALAVRPSDQALSAKTPWRAAPTFGPRIVEVLARVFAARSAFVILLFLSAGTRVFSPRVFPRVTPVRGDAPSVLPFQKSGPADASGNALVLVVRLRVRILAGGEGELCAGEVNGVLRTLGTFRFSSALLFRHAESILVAKETWFAVAPRLAGGRGVAAALLLARVARVHALGVDFILGAR